MFARGFARGSQTFQKPLQRHMSAMLFRDTNLMSSNAAALMVSLNHQMQLQNIINATLLACEDEGSLAAILDDELSQLL